MFKKSICITLVSIISFIGSGCSTLVKGNRQLVTINSEPSGAKVKLSNGLKGTTPYTADLQTGSDYVVEVTKEGYQEEQVQITKEFRPVTTIFGNILWLLIGVIVDFSSGSAYGLNPTAVNVELERAQ
ncbi:MAG: PEGA domain-containing protein [Candidatus Omnitrophota bacterium]